ncbi:cystin-1 [Sigmodon hispidus]
MGSGSSRSSRIPRRRRSPERRQEGPGEAKSEGGTADQAPTAKTQEETGRDPRPATPPRGREETLRLLDQLLAESEAWGPQEPTPRGPARLPPMVSPEKKVKDNPEDSCASEAPGSSHERPEGQSAISYDYSEEELMASIEREYGS